MFALKTGTKPCITAHFLTTLRVFATRSIHHFHGDEISFRFVVRDDAGLLFIAPLSGIVGPLRSTCALGGNFAGRRSV